MEQKIYVCIGEDVHDGFQTLEWALRNWPSQSITIFILYADNSICKNYVYTPIGKLPSSSVNDEKLKHLDKYEEAKTDKILANYIAFCGKVKAETIKIQRNEGSSIEKIMVDLIHNLQITKLVLSLTFMNPLSWKCRGALRGLFYIHKQKPDFCELFAVFGGELVLLVEENGEEAIKNDSGVVIAKIKEKKFGFRALLERMIQETAANNCEEKKSIDSLSSSTSNGLTEVELYLSELSSANADKTDCEVAVAANDHEEDSVNVSENKTTEDRVEALKKKIREVQEQVQLNKKEAKNIVERQAKAECAIRLCKNRVEELESRTNEEMAKRACLEEEIDSAKEELHEVQTEVEEKRAKLSSIMELQRELSSRLQISSQEKSCAEVQLERAVRARNEMVQGIEKLRRQRDVLRRRIEFCREKDAIGQATRQFSTNNNQENLGSEMIKVKKKADEFLAEAEVEEDNGDVPSVFFCPIFQDVMKNPHVAADGFSYELEAIEEWLRTGGAISPMTNLELKHKFLTPNHNLRSLINEWQNKKSTLSS